MRLTVVSNEVIGVDYKVLALMTDNSTVELSLPWGCPQEKELRQWRWQTREQLVKLAQNYNSNRKCDVATRLHEDKVRRLGWDYARRGY